MFATVIFHAYAPITVPIVTATTYRNLPGSERSKYLVAFPEKKRTARVTRILFTTRYSCAVYLFLGKREGKKEEEEWEKGSRKSARKGHVMPGKRREKRRERSHVVA